MAKYVVPEKYRPKPRDLNKKPEKVWGCTLGSFLGLIGVFIAKYLVDFLLLPKLFPAWYPLSAAAIIAWLISAIIFTFVAMKFVSGLIYFYYVADLVYAVLVAILPMGLFGTAELFPGIVLAIIMAIMLYFLQRFMLWLIILWGFVRM